MSGRERPIVARVEDADELGNIIAGTDRYASSVAPSSPVKEQPNTGRARRDKARRGSSSPITTSPPTDSDSTVHPRRDMLKKPSKDRDKSVSGSKKALMAASSRPPVKHAKTTTSIPPRRDDASYYGVDPTITPATSRPRAQTSRPSSYYGPTRPPPSNARFYAQPPPPSIPPSYPPPSWMAGPGSVPPPYGSPSPAPMIMQQPSRPPPSDYARPLESRFGSARPVSAMGFRPPRAIEYDDYEEPPFDRALARRPSVSRKVSKHEEDRRAMPPPPRRPASARPTALAYRPPPPTPSRQKVNFEDIEPDLDDPLFGDSSPLAPRNYEYTAPIPFQPRPRFTDLGYDGHGGYHTEVAGKNRRRNSYYGGGQSGSSGSAYEDKLQHAASYQEQATGFSMPLTAETLRKAGKSGASSRSTRSSGSHDESDYRGQQSATTRTTRSTAPPPGGGAAADEDVTIRVRGSTVLKFGNTEMQCEDGAEINITSRGGNAATEILRAGGGGSDRSSFYAPDPLLLDDRRTRVDVPVTSQRARATSRARSRARSYSSRPFSGVYDASPLGPPPPMYPLEFDTYSSSGGIGTFAPLPPHHPLAHHPAPLPPPYPEYPSSYSSRHGGEYFPPPI